MPRIIGVAMLALGLAAVVQAQPGEKEYWEGARAINSGQFEKGLALYEAAIAKGNQKAKNAVVLGYSFGNPFPHDYPKALKLARKYLNLNDIESMWQLAIIHENGHGIKKDPDEAERMLRRIVKIGNRQTHGWHIQQAEGRLRGIDNRRREAKQGKATAAAPAAAAPAPTGPPPQKYAVGTFYKANAQPWGDDWPWLRIDGYDPATGVYRVMRRQPTFAGHGYEVVMDSLRTEDIDQRYTPTPGKVFCDQCAGSGWVPEFYDKSTTSYTWGSSSGKAKDYGLYAEAESTRELGRAQCPRCAGKGGRSAR